MDNYFIENECEIIEKLNKKSSKEIADFLGIEFDEGIGITIEQFKNKLSPLKPVVVEDEIFVISDKACPFCNEDLTEYYEKQKYCSNCGQKIDWENKHSEHCKYDDDDKLLYARMELNGEFYLISAAEHSVFDKYLEKAEHKDKDVVLDMEQSDNEPYQLVYGAILINETYTKNEIVSFLDEMKDFAMADLEENKVNISGFSDIKIFDNENDCKMNMYPFAALMRTPHRLQNMNSSVTLFPLVANHYVWESMINRPFLLACRESKIMDNINIDNWTEFIDINDLMKFYAVADLLTE